jgi:hypothetical protein
MEIAEIAVQTSSQATPPNSAKKKGAWGLQLKRSKSLSELTPLVAPELANNPTVFNFNEMEFMSQFRVSLNFSQDAKDKIW